MSKNYTNPNWERDGYLKKILEGIITIANSNNGKRVYVINILSLLVSIGVVAVTIAVPKYAYVLDKINKPLLFDEDVSIKSDDKSDNYKVSFSIKQGGIKKGYLVFESENGEIIYENIIENLVNDSIQLNRESHTENIYMTGKEVSINLSNNVNEYALFDQYIKVKKIEDFSLVMLDTTGQWWIYYFVTSPEFIPIENVVYNFEVKTDDSKIIVSTQESLDKQEMGYVMIDGTLTSTASIEKMLQNLETDYKLFSERREIVGENGEKFKSQPIMKDVYSPPRAEDVYNDIIRIRNDINAQLIGE